VDFGLIGTAGTASLAARPKNGSASSAAGGDAAALASFVAAVDALAGDDAEDGSTGEEIDVPDAQCLVSAGPACLTDAAEDAARRLSERAVGAELPPTLAPAVPPVRNTGPEAAPLATAPGIGIPSGESPVDAPLDLPLRPTLPSAPDTLEINPDVNQRWKDEPPVLDLPLRMPQPGEAERSALENVLTSDARAADDDNAALTQAFAQAERAMSFRAALRLSLSPSAIGSADGTAGGSSTLSRSIAEMIARAFPAPATKAESATASAASLTRSTVIAPQAAALITHALGTGFSTTLAAQTLTQPPVEASPASTAMQIVQAMRMQWSRGVGEAHITLEPQHFGRVSVSLRVEDGRVVARLQAETPIVREWLQTNQASLRQSLAEQHLTLHRLEITEPSTEARHDEPRESGSGEARERQTPRRPRRDETGETFDVVV
jgi:flagellar hook-length control protein FliK